MKIKSKLTIMTLTGLLTSLCFADTVKLFTSTVTPKDTNWDFWQQDQPEDVNENAIYHCMFDGASGHSDYQPEHPIDGNVDGVYTTMSMGDPCAPITNQSIGVSGTSPIEFPNDQRDTRVSALFNLTKVMQLNSTPNDINECKFKWSIDYVMPWAGSQTYLQAPTTLYVGVFAADKQNYWRSDLDGNDLPTTDINDLQDEFDPNGASILYAEKAVDIRVDDSPWAPGEPNQPLTNWYLEQEQYGNQFYEVGFTQEVKDLIASDPDKYADPNTAFIGFTIRASLDGESVYLSMDATITRHGVEPIPPTLEIDVTTYIGDFNADGIVNFLDFGIFAKSWLSGIGDESWDFKCNLDNSGSSENIIDFADLNVFCENWLEGSYGQ
jgi:hypothetical protein